MNLAKEAKLRQTMTARDRQTMTARDRQTVTHNIPVIPTSVQREPLFSVTSNSPLSNPMTEEEIDKLVQYIEGTNVSGSSKSQRAKMSKSEARKKQRSGALVH